VDTVAVKSLLDIFGYALGLKCNLGKTSISPIYSDEEKESKKSARFWIARSPTCL
jgi:hypothetical protein